MKTRYYFVAFLRGDGGSFSLGNTYAKQESIENNPQAELVIKDIIDLISQQAKHVGIISYNEVSEECYRLNLEAMASDKKIQKCNACGTIDKTGERSFCEKCMRPF